MKNFLPCGLAVSRLGFGCSGLMARLSRGESLRLLEVAFENGITHFDTARLYGYGEAESVLGDFMRTRRGAVTVTTKAGILPPARSALMSAARAAARRLAQLHPAVRLALRRRAEAMTQHGHFDPLTISRSIETSLREMRTDHIDVLLLHDCNLGDLADPSLASCLENFQASGKIGHFGVATTKQAALDAQAQHPDLARIVQVENNPWQVGVDEDWRTGTSIFTHSPMGGRFQALRHRFDRDAGTLKRWADVLEFDPRDQARLAGLFLSASLAANQAGCVLFSSQRVENIARNAQSVAAERAWRILCKLASDPFEPVTS